MKIHLRPSPPVLSRALTRVADALERTVPAGVTLVPDPGAADLTVHHVLGRGQLDAMRQDIRSGRPFAALQYCLRSSDVPDVDDWVRIWGQARLVWSYYDLTDGLGTRNFYHAPLGVDRTVFNETPGLFSPGRPYLLCTTGYVAETESLQECADAVALCGGKMIHLGPSRLNLGPHVDYLLDLTDSHVAEVYRASKFVAGLRRIEGFELPVIEGFACGAIPITFDGPHYRWFRRFAWQIPEAGPELTVLNLQAVLARGMAKLHNEQGDPDVELRAFDWDTITRGFWERLLA